jgi:hypothetical protein
MTRFIHDQFAKDYLEELLKPYGKVEAPSHVPGEIREIDVLFTPFPEQKADITLLGLLGKLATTLVQNGVNKPTILNPPKAYTVFILTFDF